MAVLMLDDSYFCNTAGVGDSLHDDPEGVSMQQKHMGKNRNTWAITEISFVHFEYCYSIAQPMRVLTSQLNASKSTVQLDLVRVQLKYSF